MRNHRAKSRRIRPSFQLLSITGGAILLGWGLAWLLAPSFEQQQANTLLQLSVTHGPLGIAVHSYILALLFLTFGDGLQRGGGKPFQGLQVSLGAWAQSVKAVLITVSLGFLFSLLATFCFSLDQRYGKELLMAEGWDEGMRDLFSRFLQMQMGLYTYFLAHGNTMRACFCTEEETFLNTIQLWSQEGGWMLPCCLLSINVFVLARLRWPIPCESTSHWRMTGRFTGIYTLTVTALGLLAKSYFVISSAGEATHSLLTTQIGPSIPSLFVMAASISFFSVFIAGLILQVRGRRER